MLNENFSDILRALNEAAAEYLLVGAYAMAVHGCPRATGDIDIWVRPTSANAERVWQALRVFRAPLSRVTPTDFATPNNVYQIGLPPQRIDILTSVSGVEFEAAWAERMEFRLDNLQIPVISLTHLIVNKLATGREKDLLDTKLLASIRDAKP